MTGAASKKPMRGFAIALTLSALIHIGLIMAFLWGGTSTPKIKPPEKVITTVLVRQGEKERPKHLLPRLPSAPPPAPAPVVKEKAPEAPVKQEKTAPPKKAPSAPSLQDRINRLSKMQKALERISKEEDNEGEPDASPQGKVSSFTQAVIGNRYVSEVKEAIMRNFQVPNIIDEATCATLKAVALIRIGPDGSLIAKNIEQSSGDRNFDSALMQAITRTSRMPVPPPEIMERVRDDGIELHAPCKAGP